MEDDHIADSIPVEMLLNNVSPSKNYDCFCNAVSATIRILAVEPSETPRIYSAETTEGTHAYLVLQGKAYSNGVTWLNDYYPELTFGELKEAGKDITTEILAQVLGAVDDERNYKKLVSREFGEQGISLARVLYNRLESDSTR